MAADPEMADTEGNGCDAALRTATVHLCVWSGGADNFSAAVSGVDVDPMRMGRWTATPCKTNESRIDTVSWAAIGQDCFRVSQARSLMA